MSKKTNNRHRHPVEVVQTTVDVVIPLRGKLNLLEQCISCVPLAFDDYIVNIIVVDNASSEVEKDTSYLSEIDGFSHGNVKSITVLKQKTNLGFPKACNIGARRKSSPFKFFLNSDCFMEKKSGNLLIKAFEDEKVGVAGMKLLFPDHPTGLQQTEHMRPMGKVQHIGLSTKINGTVHHVFLGWHPDHPKVNKVREVLAVTGAALMVRRNIFQKIGGFFEGYGNGCLSGDTYVFTDKGIEELSSFFYDDEELHDIDVKIVSEDRQEKASLAYNNGVKPTLKVKLEKDFQVHGTYNHKVRTMNNDGTIGWKQLDELKIGDYVPVRYGMNSFGTNHLDDNLAYLIGLYLAEGSYEKQGRITIVSKDKETQNFLLNNFQFKGQKGRNEIHWRKSGVDFCKEISKYIDLSKKALTKELSPFLMQMDRTSTVALLQGMFDGDGCGIKDGRVNYSTSSYKLAQQLQMILLNFGCVIGIYPRICNTGHSTGTINYLLDFGSHSKRFYDLIGFRLERKQENKDFVRSTLSPKIPYQRDTFRSLYFSVPEGHRDYKTLCMHGNNKAQGVRLDTINLLLDHAHSEGIHRGNNEFFDRLCSSVFYADWYWLKVKSIEDGEKVPTYDLHVPNTNTYLANGVVVHNTYEDVDLSVTIRSLGYNIIVVPQAVGVHYTGATAEAYGAGFPINQNASLFLSRHMDKVVWWDYWLL